MPFNTGSEGKVGSRTPAVPRLVARYRAEIERTLRFFLLERRLPLYGLVRYHLGFEDDQGESLPGYAGKALRPSLLLFAHEALGGEWPNVLPAATALELAHSFSLVHDDIQDGDRERHGHPTVWQLAGSAQAINAGDALRELAALAMFDLETCFPAKAVLRASQALDKAVLEMIEGQYLDLRFQEWAKIAREDYLEMAERKTGALLGVALRIGALLTGEDEEVISTFENCGRKLGLCFQIKDDQLGIWGDGSQTGKSIMSDIRGKKKSFPIVLALNGPRGDELAAIYARPTVDEADLQLVLQILGEAGAREMAQEAAEDYCSQALAELLRVELPPWAGEMVEELAQFLLTRER